MTVPVRGTGPVVVPPGFGAPCPVAVGSQVHLPAKRIIQYREINKVMKCVLKMCSERRYRAFKSISLRNLDYEEWMAPGIAHTHVPGQSLIHHIHLPYHLLTEHLQLFFLWRTFATRPKNPRKKCCLSYHRGKHFDDPIRYRKKRSKSEMRPHPKRFLPY